MSHPHHKLSLRFSSILLLIIAIAVLLRILNLATTPTLVMMNSTAWGHILRLAYYIPPTLPVMLLAQKSAQLAPALEKSLSSEPTQYQRILWLDSADPVWSPASTDAERRQVRQVLDRQFQLEKTQQLVGTMKLDQFVAHLYQRSAPRA